MRTITDHIVNPANDKLVVIACGRQTVGGAPAAYQVSIEGHTTVFADIVFQDGAINEVGVNGLTHEVLLAIVADRLREFQRGPYANTYNEMALNSVLDASRWLHQRTLARMRRGVEGTHTV